MRQRTSCVSMRRVRSVSGHVSPVRCLKPAPLGSRRITRVHRDSGYLRLPTDLLPSSLFRLVGKCAGSAPPMGSPGLLPILVVRLDAVFDPGWTWSARLDTDHVVACWRLETIGPFLCGHLMWRARPNSHNSGLNTFTVGFTRYHCSSPAFVPTHQARGYPCACKARYPARG